MNLQGLGIRSTIMCLVLAVTLWLTGCSDMSPTAQRTLSGGAIGAGSGAVIGAIAGNAGKIVSIENGPNIASAASIGASRRRRGDIGTVIRKAAFDGAAARWRLRAGLR